MTAAPSLVVAPHFTTSLLPALPRTLHGLCSACPAKGRSCMYRSGPRQLYAYWQRRRGDRPWPSYAEIEPILVSRLQPHIFLADVETGRRFRYWRVGAAIEAVYGLPLADRAPTEVWAPEVAHVIEQQYAGVVETGRPQCHHPAMLDGAGAYRYYTRLLLPLSSTGRAVDMLLGGLFPQLAYRRGRG